MCKPDTPTTEVEETPEPPPLANETASAVARQNTAATRNETTSKAKGRQTLKVALDVGGISGNSGLQT